MNLSEVMRFGLAGLQGEGKATALIAEEGRGDGAGRGGMGRGGVCGMCRKWREKKGVREG